MIKVVVGVGILLVVGCMYAIIVKNDTDKSQEDEEQIKYISIWKEEHPDA